jgi:hypothetical protein
VDGDHAADAIGCGRPATAAGVSATVTPFIATEMSHVAESTPVAPGLAKTP